MLWRRALSLAGFPNPERDTAITMSGLRSLYFPISWSIHVMS